MSTTVTENITTADILNRTVQLNPTKTQTVDQRSQTRLDAAGLLGKKSIQDCIHLYKRQSASLNLNNLPYNSYLK